MLPDDKEFGILDKIKCKISVLNRNKNDFLKITTI